MNHPIDTAQRPRFADRLRDILIPGPDGHRGLLVPRLAVGAVTVVGTLVQIVVWLLIAVFTGSLDVPYWLYTAVPGLVLATALWAVDEHPIAYGRSLR